MTALVYLFLTSQLFNFNVALPIDSSNESTLKLVHVVFRHGDRTPEFSYPLDPNRNESYYPFGYAQLTNKGRRKEYQLGKALRNHYNSFLGHTYTINLIEPTSTNTNRTKMSLELVLANLFPPVGMQQWTDDNINWQPIPYNVYDLKDMILIDVLQSCPNYFKMYTEYVQSNEGRKTNKRFWELKNYLAEKTGFKVDTPYDAYGIHLILTMQKEWGLELPSWTETLIPELKKMVIAQYYSTTATPAMRKLAGGYLIKKMIDDSNALIDGRLKPNGRKLFLYSAHDTTVLYLLRGTKVFYPHTIPYGAYFILELHLIDGQYGFIIRYQDYSDEMPSVLTVPGCEEFCPIEKFVKLISENLPDKYTSC